MGAWMACCHKIFIKRKRKEKKITKKKKKKIDIVCDKYTVVFKLGSNWNGQGLKIYAN
jgi:hypothetical protein